MLLVTLGAWALYLRSEWNAAIDQGYSKSMTLAKSIGGDLDGVFRDYGEVLGELVSRPQVRRMDRNDCDPMINHFDSLYTELISVSIRDTQGNLVCSSMQDAPYPINPAYVPLLEKAITADGPYFTGVLYPPTVNLWVVIVTHAIRDQAGKPVGVVIAAIDLEQLSKRLLGNVPANAIATVVDPDLNVALRSRDLLDRIGKPLPEFITDIYRNGGEGTFIAKDLAGVRRIGAFTQLPRSKWIVALGYPLDEFLLPFKTKIFVSGLLGLVVTSMAFGLAWVFARSISTPVKQLAKAAGEFAEGDLSVRLQPAGPYEIYNVGERFNQMFDALRHSIQERAASAESLRLSEERFRLLAHATSDVVWDWNVRTDEVWWSDHVKSRFGHDFPDPVLSARESHRLIAQEDRDRVRQSLSTAFADGHDIWREQYDFTCSDGSVVTCIASGFVIRDAQGAPTRVLGSIVDITERAKLEEQVRQSQKLEAMGQLTGGFAHDFNNLLTIILGKAEFLSDILPQGSEEARLASRIQQAAERGAELTNHLLAYARKQPLAPELIRPGAVVEGMRDLLDRALPADIELAISCKSNWYALIDKAQLSSATLNLVLNARDAMPDGGKVTISATDQTIGNDPSGDLVAGEYVVITVTDHGAGIPEHLLHRVFEPFFTTKEVGRGSGLGLSMVQGFVRQSSGTVRIESQLGVGTSLSMYFPRSKGELLLPSKRGDAVSGQGERVLVVEDDEGVAAYIVNQLRVAGYKVWHAATGDEAVEMHRSIAPIDLLLADVVLPGGMNGLQLSQRLSKDTASLRTLFMSGYDKDVLIRDGRLAEGIALLRKPFHRVDLLSAVKVELVK
ncbi:ATP-binding protein [Paragemmobacter straminiformis]|uniref:histidine kinase n=1 Tax=Paragemmobacter straminiformis TaxID=2045119 RepID=A0A842IDM1_9RHOB|nr:ATP-binding protein [Gemmobacter straminiformis]MBC2837609.1 response regulator [Gemmobacter straminiformis]